MPRGDIRPKEPEKDGENQTVLKIPFYSIDAERLRDERLSEHKLPVENPHGIDRACLALLMDCSELERMNPSFVTNLPPTPSKLSCFEKRCLVGILYERIKPSNPTSKTPSLFPLAVVFMTDGIHPQTCRGLNLQD